MPRCARVAELADALDLGSSGFTVGVRVPSLAPPNSSGRCNGQNRRALFVTKEVGDPVELVAAGSIVKEKSEGEDEH